MFPLMAIALFSLMATVHEFDNTRTTMTTNNNNSGGLGTGGTFRREPHRSRPKTTPYDRPSIALKNHSLTKSNSNSKANGWLRKIVEPARRLIMGGAHRLFASVFPKHLIRTPHQKTSSMLEFLNV